MGNTYLKEDCCVVLVDAFEDDDEAVTSGGVAPAIDMTTCRRASSMSRGLDVSRARKCSSRDSCTMGMDATGKVESSPMLQVCGRRFQVHMDMLCHSDARDCMFGGICGKI